MSQILAVFDGLEESLKGLNNAQKLAQDAGMDLKVLGIIPSPSSVMLSKEGRVVEDTDFDLSKEEAQANTFYELLKSKGISRFEIVIGKPEMIIKSEAARPEVKAVFQETHGDLGNAFFLNDSFTEALTKIVEVPVLTYKCDRSKQSINKVLIASSFDSVGPKDLNWLNALVSKLGAEMHLLRVNTPKSFHSENEVKARMAEYASNNHILNPVFAVVDAKSVELGIMTYAAENEMDWVAIETKQRTGFSKVFKGCLSADVVSDLMMPVLTFKSL